MAQSNNSGSSTFDYTPVSALADVLVGAMEDVKKRLAEKEKTS